MTIFCLEDFKVEFDKLKSKKSYRTIEADLIDYFFNKTAKELCSGTRLNQSDKEPYIKKRINGRGGFRFYYLVSGRKLNIFKSLIRKFQRQGL